jgi:hypothetical protein
LTGRDNLLFFPLWLGCILVVDAVVWRRAGTSLWARLRTGFVLLFILSVPAWWLFEIINGRTGNWEYLGAGSFIPLVYCALCTLSFSTVMPAVFETAELVWTFRWVKSLPAGVQIPDTRRVGLGLLFAGLVMRALAPGLAEIFLSAGLDFTGVRL